MKYSSHRSLFAIGSAVLAAAWLFAVNTVQAASPGAAVVKKVVGTATYTDARGGGAIKENDILFQGATITTGAGSYVDLDLGVNGNALRVEADSTLALNKLDYTKAISTVTDTQIEVKKGAAVANVINKLSKASKYEIKTPAGVAGIRGTCVRAGVVRITCLIGTIQFTPVAGGGVMITINGGNAFSAGALAAVKAGAAETSGLAKTATQLTANAAAAQVAQVVQQFTAALAADAAADAAKTGGNASTAAANSAKAAIADLLQAVNDAAATASPQVKAAIQAVAQTLTQNSEAMTANAAASGAGIGVKVAGGTDAQASAAANTAANSVSNNTTVVADANRQAAPSIVVAQPNQNPTLVVDNRPPPPAPGTQPPPSGSTTTQPPGTTVIFVSPARGD
ncbi:MAG: hypothetical protein B9S33_22590 [Pedosphaera sp. Tous-C6FEB]|nr:MAG: hypothetical protein B9S33_22590 [Pedosphaera sp. Tous-C6FEB]